MTHEGFDASGECPGKSGLPRVADRKLIIEAR